MSEKLATFYNVVPGKTKKLIENTTPGSYLSFSKIVQQRLFDALPIFPTFFQRQKTKIFSVFFVPMKLIEEEKKITLHNSRKKKNAQKNIKKKKINLENKNEQKY